MQRAKQEQQSVPAESASTILANPAVAPKPLNSPQLTDLILINKTNTDGGSEISGPSKPAAQNTSTTHSSTEDTARVSDTKRGFPEKKDEKPSVPSKRNITPIQSESAANKTESMEPSLSQAKNETFKLPENPPADETKLESKAPALKPKPQTPPKTDFRSSLKSRQPVSGGDNEAEPEFKSVFGKLKRTQTQNYVAPDVLKGNISAGKAALNATGGPQKTKRVDEFKDSILQKKEAMKTGSGAIGKRPEVTCPTEKASDPIPEALAKRMAMQKTGTSTDKTEVKKQGDLPPTAKVSTPKPLVPPEKPSTTGFATMPTLPALKPRPAADNPTLPMNDDPAPLEWSSNNKTSSSKAEKSEAETSVLPSNSVAEIHSQMSQSNSNTAADNVASSTETAIKAKFPEHSKLAARLNPALAGILSRSGSPRPSGDLQGSGDSVTDTRDSLQPPRESKHEASSELTHMTKARAKGPKRRAPKSDASPAEGSKTVAQQPAASVSATVVPVTSSPEPLPAKTTLPLRSFPPVSTASKTATSVIEVPADIVEIERLLPLPPKPGTQKPAAAEPKRSLPSLPKTEPNTEKRSLSKVSGIPQSPSGLPSAAGAELESKSKPVIAQKSVELRKVSSTGTSSKPVDEPAPLKPKKSTDLRTKSNPETPFKPIEEPSLFKPITPKKVEIRPDPPAFLSSPPQSDGETKTGFFSATQAASLPLTPNKSKLNTPKSPKPEVDTSTKPRSAPPAKAEGLGLQLGSASKRLAGGTVLTPPPEPEVVVFNPTPPRKPMPPAKSTSSIRPQLEGFFGPFPQLDEKAEFDTHAFLSAQNKAGEKSKKLASQIWEVSGDGKRTPMPQQQEHMLFEDCMYLCVHSIQLPSGSKLTEVYLWSGDEVPEAAVEDAQLFCRKVARENGAKLEVVKQGKESSEFFLALGGIVIVRRNKSSALYMLCGRRHLGHIAFDEVDLSSNSLRTGLPFLISAKFGKLYLWKGKGSNLEDVGCARLIGMDLGLTGEIEEVSEGEEPSSFWESLSSESVTRGASRVEKSREPVHGHAPRLYRVEHDRPKSSSGLGGFWGLRATTPPKQSLRALVEEIAPFSQNDLEGHHILILDLYREIYMYV